MNEHVKFLNDRSYKSTLALSRRDKQRMRDAATELQRLESKAALCSRALAEQTAAVKRLTKENNLLRSSSAVSEGIRALVERFRAGADMLRKRPRADMPGFQPCPTDLERGRIYAMRQAEELRNREAIREGRKVYDKAAQ